MSLETDVLSLLQNGSGINVEYRPILPPSQTIAAYIAAFANADGGYLILGAERTNKGMQVYGITADFNVSPITQKAIGLLSCRPEVEYGYVSYKSVQLFAVKVRKSMEKVMIEGKEFKFDNHRLLEINPEVFNLKKNVYPRIRQLSETVADYRLKCTRAGAAFFGHYQGVLRIIDNLQSILFPAGPSVLTSVPEGKIMSRILFSSTVDNFEVFLGDLLYEISMAKPETMKSTQTVTIEEVLNCSDIEEFVKFVAKRKIGKLEKGNVKEFIKGNPPIAALDVLSSAVQADIERILQVRHLYTHRNGIIDEKFLLYYQGSLTVGTEFLLTADEILDRLEYLIDVVRQLDEAAIAKYQLE